MHCSEVIVQTSNVNTSNLNDHNYSNSNNSENVPILDKVNVTHTNYTESNWQTVSHKNKRTSNVSYNDSVKKSCLGNNTTSSNSNIELGNQFDALSDSHEMDLDNTNKSKRESKPPPIFIPDISDVQRMIKHILSVITIDEFTYKCLIDNKVKISTVSIDAYRKLIQELTRSKVNFHTFQIKSERAYRVVLKNMHFSNDPEDIKHAIEEYGHKVRNVSCMKSYKTKENLSMFFIDLEPAPNNKDIFYIEYLLNAKIYFEAPYRKNEIVQCKKCQRYGHTKSYCWYPNRCVKCNQAHETSSCKKPKETPPKCVLCDGDHPANYKGCMVYRDLKNKTFPPLRSKSQRNETLPDDGPSDTQSQAEQSPQVSEKRSTLRPSVTYANAASCSSENESKSVNAVMDAFFSKIEKLLTEQAQQIGTLINLLSTVISKLK